MKVWARVARTRHRPGEPNKLETAYEAVLSARLAAGEILAYAFESVTLVIADGVRYTPDYMVVLANGEVEFHEVKGFMRDDARVKLRVAARAFWMYRFQLAMKQKGSKAAFTIELVEP